MSVSRVVNGTRRVSPSVAEKVRTAILKIGYVPNEAARILKGNRSSVLGLIVPDLADPFFAELSNAVQQTAWNAGYLTLMAASGHREDLEISETELMVQRRVAGLIAVAIGSDNGHFAAAKRAGVPVIAIDRPMKQFKTDTLTINNYESACHATEHLLQHGHRNVLCIADDERVHTKLQRVAGYTRAVRNAGLKPRTCLVGPNTGSVRGYFDQLLTQKDPPTALFAASNLVAIEVLRELQRRALRIPSQMALVCFDDFSAATLVKPMITVVQQPVSDIGHQAATMLLDRLKEPQHDQNARSEHVILSTRLLIRGSCGCHP